MHLYLLVLAQVRKKQTILQFVEASLCDLHTELSTCFQAVHFGPKSGIRKACDFCANHVRTYSFQFINQTFKFFQSLLRKGTCSQDLNFCFQQCKQCLSNTMFLHNISEAMK